MRERKADTNRSPPQPPRVPRPQQHPQLCHDHPAHSAPPPLQPESSSPINKPLRTSPQFLPLRFSPSNDEKALPPPCLQSLACPPRPVPPPPPTRPPLLVVLSVAVRDASEEALALFRRAQVFPHTPHSCSHHVSLHANASMWTCGSLRPWRTHALRARESTGDDEHRVA